MPGLVTHAPVIRKISLALYGVALIPLGNVYIIGGVLGKTAAIARVMLFFLVLIVGVGVMETFRWISQHPAPSSEDKSIKTKDKDPVQAEIDRKQSPEYLRDTVYLAISGMAATMIILIANTEQMILSSSDLVQPGEGEWTFGQTLAMLLLLLPLWDMMETVRENLLGCEKKGESTQGLRGKTGESSNAFLFYCTQSSRHQ